MRIEVLGIGCPKCRKLYENVKKAAEEAGVAIEIIKVEDMEKIAASGVMITPGLVIDGKVVSSGRVPDTAEIRKWMV